MVQCPHGIRIRICSFIHIQHDLLVCFVTTEECLLVAKQRTLYHEDYAEKFLPLSILSYIYIYIYIYSMALCEYAHYNIQCVI